MRPDGRLKIIAFLGFAFAVVLAGRLVTLQVWSGETYTSQARSQHVKQTVLKANRGRILDRHGRVLATNLEAQSFFVNRSTNLSDLKAIAVSFSHRAGESESALLKRLNKDRSFIWLARKVVGGPVEEDQVPPGVGRIVEMRRTYPLGTLGAQLLGYTDIDNVGIEGLERAYNPLLSGRVGEMSSRVDARGRTLSALGVVRALPEDGSDLVLTLDADYQAIAEEELVSGVKKFSAKGGIAIVLDPRSGEILALANAPLFNPNEFGKFDPELRRNRAVTDRFEPGSTFKVVPIAAALEEKVHSPTDSVFCENGLIQVAGDTIRDTHPSGWLSVREIVEESSNIGTIKIAQSLGESQFYRYVRLFGFGSRSANGLPGEVSGEVKHPSVWSRRSLETMAIGQEVSVTALQVAAAYSTIANGGRLMAPRLFLKATRRDSLLVDGNPELVRQVISPETAATLASFLKEVVQHGTGTRAQVPGYQVAGKTGTAQQAYEDKPGYDPDRYIASFVGFLPADRPELLCFVALDSPQGTHLASQVSAPIFKRVMHRILSLRQTQLRHRVEKEPETHPGKVARFAKHTTGNEFRTKLIKNGTRDADLKEALPAVPLQSTEIDSVILDRQLIRVPSVLGATLRKAVFELTSAGLQVEISGTGRVIGQVPKPGEEVELETTCRIICRRESG